MSQPIKLHNEPQYLTLSDNSGTVTVPAHRLAVPIDITRNTLFEGASSFSYNERVRFSLSIREDYKKDFVLIRGLIEFHRTRNLKFTFDKRNRSIETDIHSDKLADLHAFLVMITDWLKKEKQFRLALKIVRAFEDRHRLESESVYQVLRNASIPRQ